jgi:hypothetical protein
MFLHQVVLAVNRLFPKEQNIKRITITDEEVYEPYRIEDIHLSRQNDFEKEVERKRLDLENYMTPQKPKEFDFSDRASDEKITAMDSLVAQKVAQRKLDIEQFQNGNYNTTNIDPEKWLSSKETSLKGEGIVQSSGIINNNNISLVKEKKVTWDDDQELTTNIFQKLKKKTEDLPLIASINENIKQKHYIEQQSEPLPDVKQEQIIRTIPVNNIIQNNSIIPTNEIAKQMNEMNVTIHNLYDMVSKLTKIIENNTCACAGKLNT